MVRAVFWGVICSSLFWNSCRLAEAQGYPAAEAARKMTVPAGLQVELLASEPLVRQPVCIEFDDRGRLWVIQYLQYPNPAGLQRVQVDRFSRTQYDRVPEPPPRGPRGADRISILEDTDGDGKIDSARDFIDGLNLSTGMAFGHGGVFVLQVPYLLFYPDRNRDDVPDADPEVLLTGFGMEDAHSVANSLTWGPDGWLYGCQGSTVTAQIRGIEFQQGVWRYHPLTKEFELFCEGGGNSWGLDFDRHGQLIYSTNHGGYIGLHAIQGGYFWKSFGKHGALHNPYAYGYFDHIPHANPQGGHVSAGGVFYRANNLPAEFRDKYIAADLLGHNVYWHQLTASGASFTSRQMGTLLQSNDTWFAPCDVTIGPDGAVYVTDWHDQRTAHPDPDAEWDRTNGRIYRISNPTARPAPAIDLHQQSSDDLVQLLRHPNDWYARRARRILGERQAQDQLPGLLTQALTEPNEEWALNALWALYVAGGWNDDVAQQCLAHSNPHLRLWAVRWIGDATKASSGIADRLIELSQSEPDLRVRSQLAASAQRLPADIALPMIAGLLQQPADQAGNHLPLQLWWAVEKHAVTGRAQVLETLAQPALWQRSIYQQTIAPRLVRRYAAEGTADGLQACGAVLAAIPTDGRRPMLRDIDDGLPNSFDASQVTCPPELLAVIRPFWSAETKDVLLLRVLARLGEEQASQRLIQLAHDEQLSESIRIQVLQTLGLIRNPQTRELALDWLSHAQSDGLRVAAVEQLSRFDDVEVQQALLNDVLKASATLRPVLINVLLSRKSWSLSLLKFVQAGKLPTTALVQDQLRQVARHQDDEQNEIVRKLWGSIREATPEERLAEVRRLNNDLRAFGGSAAAGVSLFQKKCATCHTLYGSGGKLGPELTQANRQDRDFLLISLIDPSAVIRKEFLNYTVETTDGRVLSGLLVENSDTRLTLVNPENKPTSIPRDQVAELVESPVSFMPENLLKDLSPQELRDLFAYLQSTQAPVK